MKKAIIFLFLFSYIVVSVQAFQWMKLPILVEHYLVHHSENRHTSLFDFLTQHYGHGIINDDDLEQDMKLPFKSDQGSETVSASLYTLLNEPITLEKPVMDIDNQHPEYKDPFRSSNDQSSIWQPPKHC